VNIEDRCLDRRFQSSGQTYRPPKPDFLEPGPAWIRPSGDGPFYCPADERVYLTCDSFRNFGIDSARRLRQAYVVAHEFGHHVRIFSARLLGGTMKRQLELQADCLAGVWANHNQEVLNRVMWTRVCKQRA
jgi:predicted metalloprotease